MLFWLKKTLTLPFLPLHFTLIVGTLGVVLLLLKKRQKLGRLLVIAAVFVLAVFSNRSVAILLLAPLETHYPAIPAALTAAQLPPSVAACRTIVVLGGGHGDSPALPPLTQLSTSALARLAEGVRLAHLLPDAKLVVSGHSEGGTFSHAQILAEAAQSLGIAPSRIIRFDHTRDTEEEARTLAREIGPQPFLLVTSAWHMPRAMALCENAGLHPLAAPTDFMLRSNAPGGRALLAWDLSALEHSTKAIHERLGLFWSRIRGRS